MLLKQQLRAPSASQADTVPFPNRLLVQAPQSIDNIRTALSDYYSEKELIRVSTPNFSKILPKDYAPSRTFAEFLENLKKSLSELDAALNEGKDLHEKSASIRRVLNEPTQTLIHWKSNPSTESDLLVAVSLTHLVKKLNMEIGGIPFHPADSYPRGSEITKKQEEISGAIDYLQKIILRFDVLCELGGITTFDSSGIRRIDLLGTESLNIDDIQLRHMRAAAIEIGPDLLEIIRAAAKRSVSIIAKEKQNTTHPDDLQVKISQLKEKISKMGREIQSENCFEKGKAMDAIGQLKRQLDDLVSENPASIAEAIKKITETHGHFFMTHDREKAAQYLRKMHDELDEPILEICRASHLISKFADEKITAERKDEYVKLSGQFRQAIEASREKMNEVRPGGGACLEERLAFGTVSHNANNPISSSLALLELASLALDLGEKVDENELKEKLGSAIAHLEALLANLKEPTRFAISFVGEPYSYDFPQQADKAPSL